MQKKCINKIVTIEIILLVIMLVRPATAMQGARNGLILWAYTVLPGIFPAGFLASVIMSELKISAKYMKIYVIICGILTGFPGAAILYSQFKNIYKDDTSLDGVLAYCNISSPSFICNYIYAYEVMHRVTLSKLIIIIYASSIAGVIGSLVIYKILHKGDRKAEIRENKMSKHIHTDCGRLMEVCCINMLKAGGYIVFFACVSQYIINILPDSFTYRGIITGIIEITTGINQIGNDYMAGNAYWLSDGALIIILINNFGGLSTILQTISVAGAGINIKKYIYNKCIYCVITVLVYTLAVYVL